VYVAGDVTSFAERCAVGNGHSGRDGYAAAHGKRNGNQGARSCVHGAVGGDGDADKETTAHRDLDCYGDADSNVHADSNAYPRAHL
jgi:hypothetical protein